MAARAGIGSANFQRKVGTGNTDAVVEPAIYSHVGGSGHVTFAAVAPGTVGVVEVMFAAVVLGEHVAFGAQYIVGCFNLLV